MTTPRDNPPVLVRLESWPSALMALVRDRTAQPFAWGSHDCCLFAADCIQAMTGVDPAKDLRGYASALGAARLAKARAASAQDPFGVESWPALLGLPEIDVRAAQRGDIVLVTAHSHRPGRLALAVCLGDVAAVPGIDGLQFPTMGLALRAWRVG